MGKNHRHKKNLKADKAKVKLKQSKTKFLPKGLNETKATFKLKSIVLPEQLREKSTDIPLSKRKLNIKEICSRINHHNENVRFTACEDLGEMFKHYPEELIRENLSVVISSVSNLMQDRERKVRDAAVKVLTIILEMTPSEKLDTFFDYFSTNLCCAMTNIDRNIQEDSLKFLDCFLVKDCGFISKTSNKLLPNFFILIAKLKAENNISRTMTLNLNSKMTNATWKIKVLSRLHVILSIILRDGDSEEEEERYILSKDCDYIPIYKNGFLSVLSNTQWCTMKDFGVDINTLHNYLPNLIPIFYEIWMEVLPQKTQKSLNESTSLSHEQCAILSSVVNTMYLLWIYIEKHYSNDSNLKSNFMSKEATNFLSHLRINFPYTRQNDLKLKRTPKLNVLSLDLDMDPKCVKQNVTICCIYFLLNENFARKSAKAELECIAAYINKCLLTENYVGHNNIIHIIDFIRMSLVEKCHVWKKSKIDARHILNNAITFYESVAVSEKNKAKMLNLFASLVDNPYLSNSSHYHSWLSTLPVLLCKPQISDAVIEILLILAKKDISHFLNAVKSNMDAILSNLDSLKIIMTKGHKDESASKREIAFIFYYIKNIPCLEVKKLLGCLSNSISQEDTDIIKEYVHKCGDNCVVL